LFSSQQNKLLNQGNEKENKVNEMKAIKTLGKISLGIVVGMMVLFSLFYVLTIGEYIVPKTVAQDSSLPHVTIDGVTYHAETFGDPPTRSSSPFTAAIERL
jgi:hypothetical protein